MLPRLLIAAAAAATALALPATAAAKTLTTIDTPSVNVDPSKVKFNGGDHPRRLRANVLLPDGYDGKGRFPVLYLLHGAGDAYDSWVDPERGNVLETAKDLDAIVVMPEGDTGFYTNWWNGGRRGDPGWERFYLDELIPLVEKRYRVRPGRRWHAAAGLSMGGFGATFLATQRPEYFGSAATFSGFVSHQRPQAVEGLRLVAGVGYEDVFGPVDAFYATGHNPPRLVDNLRSTRLYVTVGNGVSDQDTDPGRDHRGRGRGGGARRAGEGARGRGPGSGRGHHLRAAERGALLALLAPPPARRDRLGPLPARSRGAALLDLWHRRAAGRGLGAAVFVRSGALGGGHVHALGRAAARRRLGHGHRAQRRGVRLHSPVALRALPSRTHVRTPGRGGKAPASASGPHHQVDGAGHAQGGRGAPAREPRPCVDRAACRAHQSPRRCAR